MPYDRKGTCRKASSGTCRSTLKTSIATSSTGPGSAMTKMNPVPTGSPGAR